MAPGGRGQSGGNGILQIDPDAVPLLRKAFVDALGKVDKQLEVAEKELRVTSWAQDPVSLGATTVFNDQSVDGAQSAVDSLRAYREQLSVAVTNLDRTAEQYREVDGSGKAAVDKND